MAELLNRMVVNDPTDALNRTEAPSDSYRSSQDHTFDGWTDLEGSAGITMVAGEVLMRAELVRIDPTTGRVVPTEADTGSSKDAFAVGATRTSAAPAQDVEILNVPGTRVPVLFAAPPAAADNGRVVCVSAAPGEGVVVPPGVPDARYAVGILIGADGATFTPDVIWNAQLSPVFGSEYNEAEDLPEGSEPGLLYVQQLRITTNTLPAGDYRIGFSLELRTSNNNRAVGVRVQLDGSVDLFEQEDLINTTYQGHGGWRRRALTAGIHTIDVDIRRVSAMAATAFVRNITLEIWRIS